MERNEHGNVILKDGFSQVVIWPGTVCGEGNAVDFEKFILDQLKTRCQYLEEIRTNKDFGDEESGGRNDIFFAVHSEDVGKFAVPRFAFGMRWIEDIYGNGGGYLYPARVEKYKTWDAGIAGGATQDKETDEV